MMVTIKNYFETIKALQPDSLPANLREGYEFVKELTEDHTTWEYYNASSDIRTTVDNYLAALSGYLRSVAKEEIPAVKPVKEAKQVTEADARNVAKDLIRSYVKRGESIAELNRSSLGSSYGKGSSMIRKNKIYVDRVGETKVDYSFPLHSIYHEILEEEKKSVQPAFPNKPTPKKKKTTPATPKATPVPKQASVKTTDVDKVDESVRFIKRYAGMHDKMKTEPQILNFINALQKAILERRIRKTDKYADAIKYIQDNLVKVYAKMGNKVHVVLRPETLERFTEIGGSQKQRLSVAYMKRYVGIQGKDITREKAQKLYNLIKGALEKQKITGNDPYKARIDTVLSSLKQFAAKAKRGDTLQIHQSTLNGIKEALDGCCAACDAAQKKGRKHPCKSVNGLDGIPQPEGLMNSMDFAGLQFETLGFSGKWKELIGDPTPGFTAMVSGAPKMGKSYLCVDFAGYLARHHGKTLYVAGEEKLGKTLQEKIDSVKHPQLDVAGLLPDDLIPYQFIVLDSVSRMKLTPDKLRELKAQYPDKAFIYVYQVTKSGKFRGSQDAEHDVDIVIRVPEKGKAIQIGRFNQGGEMNIFEDTASAA